MKHYALAKDMDKALIQLGIVKGVITRSWVGEDQPDSTEPEIPYIQLALEGRIAAERELYDESIEKFEKSLKRLLPYNSGGMWRTMADVYIKAGQPDTAIALLNQALVWNPNSALCLKSLADAYEMKGMKKEQAETLERFLVVARDADESLKGLREARAALSKLEGTVL
jgi:tetratricopeptide (TPR) repeat protein